MWQADQPTTKKVERFRQALDALVERLKDDPHILGIVRLGSLDEVVIWRKDALDLWLVEADGVSRRHASDGKDERRFRTLVEQGVRFHVEMIARSRFKRMVEGTSRTAFTHSLFQRRKLIYSADPSLPRWFEDADTLSTHDRRRELLVVATWAVHCLKQARRQLQVRRDPELCRAEIMHLAWCLAAISVVRHGEIWEDEVIYRGAELEPDLFQSVYFDLLKGSPEESQLDGALELAESFLADHEQELFVPLFRFLKKRPPSEWVPLSELADHFAHTQLYPWHLESACEWLCDRGALERFSAPYKLTLKSKVEMEEPAYVLGSPLP